jgi:hypothetical protein
MENSVRVFLRMANFTGLLQKLVQQEFINGKGNTLKIKKMVFSDNISMINCYLNNNITWA